MPFALLFAAFLVIAITIAVVGWRLENRRRDELAALARRLALAFDPGRDPDHDDHYAQFEVFRRGHSRAARNTMHGTLTLFDRPCRVRAGDFRYRRRRSDGKGSRTYRFSYLIVHPPWPTPALLVRPEGLFDKVASAFGFDDIDFESDEFSRAFHVTSSDKRFAYDVLHPRTMELLLAARPPVIDIEGGALCLADGDRRWSPAQFERQFAFVRRFCDLWPRHLVRDLEA